MSLLKTPESLQSQAILFVVGHLEHLPADSIALLPISIRKWLLLHLPIADVCMFERCGDGLAEGIELEEIWKARGQANIPQTDHRNKGFWKQRLLEQLWDMAMTEPSGCWLYSHLQSPQGVAKNCVQCKWHFTERGLFALDTDLSDMYTSSSVNGQAQFILNPMSRIVQYRCEVCHVSYCVPSRYVKCIVKEYNLISLLSMFYTYCHFKPRSITLCHQNMYNMVSPLSQQILCQYPSVLDKLVGETKFLKLLPLYLRPNCSAQSQSENYDTIVKCLHTSLQLSLEELNVQLLISPFEPSQVRKPFRSLKFLFIKSLQNDILNRSYAKNLITLHKPTLKVVKISQCTFKTLSPTSLTELFTSPEFSVMLLSHSDFHIDTFQAILFSFVTNKTGHQNQVLSFKASLLEGSSSSFIPQSVNYATHNSSPFHPCHYHYRCHNLNIEDIRVAFQSINQLKSSLKGFPPVHLNRLNLKEMNAIEISSSLPYVQAHELCITISTALTNWNLIVLRNFFEKNIFHGVSLCLEGKFITKSNTESIEEFGELLIRPPLRSIKFTWMPLDDEMVSHRGKEESNMALMLARITKYCQLESLELDLSEFYGTSSQSTCTIPTLAVTLHELWKENGRNVKLSKLVIGRESIDIFQLEKLQNMAEIVIEKSTICDL